MVETLEIEHYSGGNTSLSAIYSTKIIVFKRRIGLL